MFKFFRKIHSNIREKTKTLLRSTHWPSVRDKHLSENPVCAACGSKKNLQVHHKRPFHVHPELELDPVNLITLCMDDWECHLMIGHGDSFRAFNPDVLEDAKKFATAPADIRRSIIESAKTKRLT